MAIKKTDVINWMERLKAGWIGKSKEDIFKLFEKTERYYERPFKPGTTMAEIRSYWNDIDSLENISLDYEIAAIDGNNACVHWDNKYNYRGKDCHLDGMLLISFNDNKECIEFRQWWFMED